MNAPAANIHAEGIASAAALRVKIEHLRWEILAAIGPVQAALDAAKAMAEIPSDSGLLHGLRVARANGRSLWGHAADLNAAHVLSSSPFSGRPSTTRSPSAPARRERPPMSEIERFLPPRTYSTSRPSGRRT